jgi:RNA polymerase sigma-70 factor (ECF subfamily)
MPFARRKRRGPPLEAIAEQTRDEKPEDALLLGLDVAMLRDTIAALPEPFREALVLRELEELSYREIATLTATPIGTVMSRLARGRDMLGKLLLDRGQGGMPR